MCNSGLTAYLILLQVVMMTLMGYLEFSMDLVAHLGNLVSTDGEPGWQIFFGIV